MSKIVVIADFIYPNYLGGSARYVYDMIKGFEYNNIEFLLITRKKEGVFSLNEDDEFYKQIKNNHKVIEISNIKDILKSYKYIGRNDILNIHHPILGIWYSFLKNKKTYFFHGPLHEEYKAMSNNKIGYYVRYVLQKIVLQKSSKVFVLSDFMKDKVLSLYSKSNVVTIGPIFDSKKFKPYSNKNELRTKYNIPLNKTVLFTSRRLTNRTGVLELAQEFIDNFDKNKFHLIIVGKGELQYKLENLINSEKSINYFNFVSESNLLELMSLSDVYVLPTKELEGFGLVILEALSLDLPIVVSNKSGGAVEFIKQYDEKLVFNLDDFYNSLLQSIKYAISRKVKIAIKQFDYKIQSENIKNECIK